ncbi:MAG: ABC transporter permease subunit [Granulosicoccaceae bacterium]
MSGATSPRRWIPSGKTLVIAIPMIWLLVFFLIPFGVVFKLSLSEAAIARPPYLPIMEWDEEGVLSFALNIANYFYLFEDDLYLTAYLQSIKIAFVSTLLCLLVAYPMSLVIARASPKNRNILLMLVILPFWTSFLLRVYAWIGILKPNGLLNNALMGLGIIDQPLQIMQTDLAVYIGVVYTYLPFMILPLYTSLVKQDGTLLEAAADLGAKPVSAFLSVTLPLSIPGMVAGCLLVFIPVVGEFVIPALLGGPDTLMIGKVLWNEFFSNRDWPVASAVATVMLVVLVVPIMLLRLAQQAEESHA